MSQSSPSSVARTSSNVLVVWDFDWWEQKVVKERMRKFDLKYSIVSLLLLQY